MYEEIRKYSRPDKYPPKFKSGDKPGPVSEPGKDLSNPPGETKCCICGVWVDEDSYSLHLNWHTTQKSRIYTGIPVEEAIISLADQIQMLVAEKCMLQSQVNNLQTGIMDIEKTIGTEDSFRFVRDWSQP